MILGSGLIQSANTFVGAYDAIPSIAAAYSTRRLLSSYTGPLLRLVADRTGYPEQDIGYTAAGDLDTAAAAAFLAGDSGYVTKWYDQGGNSRDAAQATLAAMPLYVASGHNSKPVLYSSDGNRALVAPDLQLANNNSVLMAWMPTGIFDTDIVRYLGHLGSGQFRSITKKPGIYSSQTGAVYHSTAMANNSAALLFYTFDSNVSLELNGSNETISTSTADFTDSDFGIFKAGGTSGAVIGQIFEIIVMSVAASTSQRGAATLAANAYWSAY